MSISEFLFICICASTSLLRNRILAKKCSGDKALALKNFHASKVGNTSIVVSWDALNCPDLKASFKGIWITYNGETISNNLSFTDTSFTFTKLAPARRYQITAAVSVNTTCKTPISQADVCTGPPRDVYVAPGFTKFSFELKWYDIDITNLRIMYKCNGKGPFWDNDFAKRTLPIWATAHSVQSVDVYTDTEPGTEVFNCGAQIHIKHTMVTCGDYIEFKPFRTKKLSFMVTYANSTHFYFTGNYSHVDPEGGLCADYDEQRRLKSGYDIFQKFLNWNYGGSTIEKFVYCVLIIGDYGSKRHVYEKYEVHMPYTLPFNVTQAPWKSPNTTTTTVRRPPALTGAISLAVPNVTQAPWKSRTATTTTVRRSSAVTGAISLAVPVAVPLPLLQASAMFSLLYYTFF